MLGRLGFFYEKVGDLEKAAECYEVASKLEPDNGTHYWDLGSVYEKQHKIAIAIENYQRALEMDTGFGSEFRDQLHFKITKLKNIQ